MSLEEELQGRYMATSSIFLFSFLEAVEENARRHLRDDVRLGPSMFVFARYGEDDLCLLELEPNDRAGTIRLDYHDDGRFWKRDEAIIAASFDQFLCRVFESIAGDEVCEYWER